MNKERSYTAGRCFSVNGGACFGAIVLGLNDALIEFSGALAGFTMGLQNNRLVFLAGLTTGVAATLSMAAAEYLSQKSLGSAGSPWSAAIATGIAYLITVALLIFPFLLFKSPFHSLAVCLSIGAIIIISFSWIAARIRGTNFWHDCLQMLLINIAVAGLAFAISWGARELWGIDV